jgi:hypothetical protein
LHSSRTRDHTSEGCLAHHKRIAPQIIIIEFDEIEGPHEHGFVSIPAPDEFKRGNAISSASNRLAVNGAGLWGSRAIVSTIRGKRFVRSLPGRL